MNPYPFARPLLFALDPERAHELTLSALDAAACAGVLRIAAGAPVDDPVEVMGLRFANRVGLAAGLDKNGAHIDAFGAMGFGFIEVGTVTPRPQPGNPKPRMFRIPQRRALINRMGFNNDGVDAFVRNVERSRWRGVLGLNIGKNADTPIEQAADDYLLCLERVYPHAGYVTVNISSPNTRNLRDLQGSDALDRLLGALVERRETLAARDGHRVPLALKIAPDLDESQIDAIAAVLTRHGIDAVIATNTTLSREAVAGLRHADEAGGLSGAPVFEASNRVIRMLRARLPADYPIIGIGGIGSAADARAKREAGATLVQLYTGLIYEGPALVGACARALRDA
ncbi:MAG: quinone-dependent dihydroorotate dehydrogenase [Burkholderiaceae bacterium]